MNTIEVLSEIAQKHTDIRNFSLIAFPQQRQVQCSLKPWGDDEQVMFEKALAMKKEYGVPFWNGVMLSAFNNEHYSAALVKSTMHHNQIQHVIAVPRKDVIYGMRYDDGQRWAVNSKVMMTDGTTRHIPMIDFHIPSSSSNLHVVEDVCDALGMKQGYIVDSGASFHFIGDRLLTEEELMRLLIDALLFCPIVDGVWISHQLRERSCSLRIDRKNGVETHVAKRLGR